jgi:hypothetical protein
MQIKFQIEYGYLPQWKNSFNAVVSAWLPKEPGEDVVAYCYHAEFNGQKVTHYSGKENGQWRVVNFSFDAESLEELDQKILTAVEEYAKKVSDNVRLIEEMKKRKKELLVELPEPVKIWE